MGLPAFLYSTITSSILKSKSQSKLIELEYAVTFIFIGGLHFSLVQKEEKKKIRGRLISSYFKIHANVIT